MILADKITLLRKKCGWSQEQLAEQLEISRQSVSKWESGASIPDLDKIIKISEIFSVSTDYLLKDEIEETTYVYSGGEEIVECQEREKVRSVSLEEATSYMDLVGKLAKKIAIGVSLCILSPACLIFLAGLSENESFGITEEFAYGLGGVILMLVIAVGVTILIFNDMKLSKYEYMKKEDISLQYGVQGIVEKKKESFEAMHRKCTAGGIALCIMAVLPLFVALGFDASDLGYACSVSVLLILIACGVYLFTWSGNIYESFEKLLQTGGFTRDKKNIRKRMSAFPKIYWCIVTAVFLIILCSDNKENRWFWLIWAVAGVLYIVYIGIFSMIVGRQKSGTK